MRSEPIPAIIELPETIRPKGFTQVATFREMIRQLIASGIDKQAADDQASAAGLAEGGSGNRKAIFEQVIPDQTLKRDNCPVFESWHQRGWYLVIHIMRLDPAGRKIARVVGWFRARTKEELRVKLIKIFDSLPAS